MHSEMVTPGQLLGIILLGILVLDFIRTSAKTGAIHIANFPAYLLVTLGRILDTLATQSLRLFSGSTLSLMESWKAHESRPLENVNERLAAQEEKNLERQWSAWGNRKRQILLHTLERSGARIMVEKDKLPGHVRYPQRPTSQSPGPLVKTLDFQVAYSRESHEVHFRPVYFYGVDPALRSSIRQRAEDGTVAVALEVLARKVSLVEREGKEVIAVKVGPATESRTLPPVSAKADRRQGQTELPQYDLSPIAEGLPALSMFKEPKIRKSGLQDGSKELLDAFYRLGIGVDSSGGSKFRHVKSIAGPAVTQVIFQGPGGIKISSLAREGENLAAELGIRGSVRIEAVAGMPGCFGVEMPNKERGLVMIREMVASPEFRESKAALPLCIGMTIEGRPLVVDLAKLPHLLVAGATNQGKSVGLNAIVVSLLLRHTPSRLKFIMVDPKAVELTVYEDLPHLLAPIATTAKEANPLLNAMVQEMDQRYELMRAKKVRNIGEYNAKVPDSNQFSYIVAVIDEYADLIMGAKNEAKDLEIAVSRLGQKARAAGLHLILATQRPTADVVTGLIKANMPGRLAYKVSANIDSQIILDRPGAETLTGMGDLLFIGPSDPEPIRAQGPLVTDEEIERVVDFWRRESKPKNLGATLKPEIDEETNPNSPKGGPMNNVVSLLLKCEPKPRNEAGFGTKNIEPNDTAPGDNDSEEQERSELYRVAENIWVEGKGSHRVNLGLPPRPANLNMSDEAWAIMYGYSVRLVVKDQAPRRDHLKKMLNIKTDVAQSIIQYLEQRSLISPYRGPKAPRTIYVTLEQVERIYPESCFSVYTYAP